MVLIFALGILVGVLLCKWERALVRRRRAGILVVKSKAATYGWSRQVVGQAMEDNSPS